MIFIRLILAFLLLCTGYTAQAAPSPIEAQARIHFDKGQKLSSEKRYIEALAEFSAGYELSRRPLFLFNMAECARLSGDRERAAQTYDRYLAADGNGKLAGMAHERLAELRGSIPPPPVRAEPMRPIPAPAPVVVAAPPPQPTPVPVVINTEPNILVASPPPPLQRPLWKRPALWIGIGAGIVVAATVGGVVGWAVTRGNGGCGVGCVDLRK